MFSLSLFHPSLFLIFLYAILFPPDPTYFHFSSSFSVLSRYDHAPILPREVIPDKRKPRDNKRRPVALVVEEEEGHFRSALVAAVPISSIEKSRMHPLHFSSPFSLSLFSSLFLCPRSTSGGRARSIVAKSMDVPSPEVHLSTGKWISSKVEIEFGRGDTGYRDYVDFRGDISCWWTTRTFATRPAFPNDIDPPR